MASSATPAAPPLRELISRLESAADPADILIERAHSIHDAEQNDHKPHRAISLLQVCATESDVDVLECEAAAPPQSSAAVAELLPVVKSNTVFGRDEEKAKLLSQLISTNEKKSDPLSVIPITGAGGVGKTTLARLVYEDPTAQAHFELRAWVKIDGHEKNQLLDIARKLLKSAAGMACTLDQLEELDEMVVDTLLSQRSLIVLDDVESLELDQWRHMLKSWFHCVGFGSNIIITTRTKQVVETVEREPFILGELCHEDSLSLYRSLAFSPSKEIVTMCNGVPLYLKLLGSLTRFEEGFVEAISSSNLMERHTSFPIILSVLSLPQHLFRCFAYCGVYPRGYMLQKEKLIKLWIADDLVVSEQGFNTLEEIGEFYFHELLCRSYFTDINWNEYHDVVQARMPSVVHETALEMAGILYKDKVGYALDVDENSLHFSMAPPFPFPFPFPLQQVHNTNQRSLQTVVSFPHINLPLTKTKLSFVDLKRLRSLDLSSSGIRKLSKHVCMLKKLKYLNLSDSLLTKLPKSFTNLTRLHTLDLSKCYYLNFLPDQMSNLSKLTHLDLSECNSLCCMPFGIERLTSLITMPLFVLGDKDHNHANLDELRSLNELRGELHVKNLENANDIKDSEDANLIKEKKLHNLVLSWSKKVDECHTVLELLEPNPHLKVLELTGYGAYGFPSWMPNLHCLVKLLINDCRCTKLPTLGELQHLRELHLKEMINLRSIGKEFYGDGGISFPSLEKLKLHDLPALSNWGDHSSSNARIVLFPKLKNLSIQRCPKLQTLPSLPFVKELVVWRSHREILPLLTKIKSLSSIVVNNMDVKEPFAGLSSSFDSVKKLIVVHSEDLDVLESSDIEKLPTLKYLRILQCHNLKRVKLHHLGSLEKLNVVDCQTLEHIDLKADVFTLTELIVEDCPKLEEIGIEPCSGSSLRKLIVRNCPLVRISKEKVKGLDRVHQWVCISGTTIDLVTEIVDFGYKM